MNRLFKPIFAVLLLLLGGCAHHAGYYSGYYGGGYGGGVSGYSAYRSYPVNYNNPGHVHKTIVKRHYYPSTSNRKAYRDRKDWNHRHFDSRRDNPARRRSGNRNDFRDRHDQRRHSANRATATRRSSDRRSHDRHVTNRHFSRNNEGNINRRNYREGNRTYGEPFNRRR